MGHREPELLGLLARQRHELSQLLGSELAGTAASFLIAQQIDEERFQVVLGNIVGRHRGMQKIAL